MNSLLIGLIVSACIAQPDPGVVVVKDAGLTAVSFDLPASTSVDIPASTAYELDYPTGQEQVWFDRARTRPALPFHVYFPRAKGDLSGDKILDGRDVAGFVTALLNSSYDAPADFNNDAQVTVADVDGFVEALLGGYPAEGVILYVEALSPSSALGDAKIDLLTRPHGGAFSLRESRALTTVVFHMPTSGLFGTSSTFRIIPAIEPLAFSTNTTARWDGEILVNNGVGPTAAVQYGAADVQEITAGTAEIIVGSGTLPPVPTDTIIAHATGVIRGRMTFNLDSGPVTTPVFSFGLSPLRARFNHLDFDPHDPGGYAPTYGQTGTGVPVLHVTVPSDPQLDTYWFYQVALDVPIAQNMYTTAHAPATITVDVRTYDGSGAPLDSMTGVTLSRIDSDGDPDLISYRSDLSRPFIFVDAAVNKASFPDLRIVQTADTGSLVVLKR